MSPASTIRISLAVLALAAFSIGFPAAFAPDAFYENFPFFASWVGLLPPFNEHLITDVGGLYLGFGLMFIWALIKPQRQLILPLCTGWLVVGVLHFTFHVRHLEGFTTTDATGQTASLALITIVALIPIAILSANKKLLGR